MRLRYLDKKPKERAMAFAGALVLASGLALGCNARTMSESAELKPCNMAETTEGKEVVDRINQSIAAKTEKFVAALNAAKADRMDIQVDLEMKEGIVRVTSTTATYGKFKFVGRDLEDLKVIKFQPTKQEGYCRWNVRTVIMRPQS
ncbi:hypothetical protein JXA56_05350 [Candidatus Micrarchaeota archaeon]|nr:hypothetical protein [Candidatus Micrarchaeota archaeon]